MWISKVCYHVHNCQTPVPILSHISPVHSTAHCLYNIQFNIILPPTYTPRSPRWPLSLRFSNQILHTSLIFRISNTELIHPSLINFIILKVTGDKCKVWSSSLTNYQQPSDIYFFTSKYSSLHFILVNFHTTFSYQFNRHSAISVTDIQLSV